MLVNEADGASSWAREDVAWTAAPAGWFPEDAPQAFDPAVVAEDSDLGSARHTSTAAVATDGDEKTCDAQKKRPPLPTPACLYTVQSR